MKPVRMNTDDANSEKLRKIQKDYFDKFYIRLPLESIGNRVMQHGVEAFRKSVGLSIK